MTEYIVIGYTEGVRTSVHVFETDTEARDFIDRQDNGPGIDWIIREAEQ